MFLPLPSFYRAEDVPTLYVERGGLVADEALQYRGKHSIAPASDDSFRVAVFGIDCQVGFCHPEASLFVPGAVEDTQRSIEWIYQNLHQISALYFSLDTHQVFQIFHPSWWVNEKGEHPAPFSVISAADVEAGTYRALYEQEASLEYCRKLESAGKYVLTVWPYHTLLGGTSHALMPALMEAALFHSVTRQQQTHFEMKGQHPQTENYSVFSPEVKTLSRRSVGRFNRTFFDTLLAYDRVYVMGQASSHCVLSSLKDMHDRVLATDPSLMSKIWILEDAMSPVTPPPLKPLPDSLNFPAIAKQALQSFASAGMQITRTTETMTLP